MEQTELAKELDIYIKKHKTQEECSGFIDGFEKACDIYELGKASLVKVPTDEPIKPEPLTANNDFENQTDG